MTRNLKALGLALLAAFALSALSASAASAATDHFTAGEETALLTGVSHDNEFKITGSESFRCTTSKFAATVTDGATKVTADVEYEGTIDKEDHPLEPHCSSSVGAVHVEMNGCDYELTGETTQEDEGTDAVVWITCPEGKKIEIVSTGLGVTVSVPPQTPTEGGVTYKPEGGKVEVNATATGITTTCAPSFLCGLGGVPTHANVADYTGTVLMTGYEDNNEHDPEAITPAEEGPEIDIGIQST